MKSAGRKLGRKKKKAKKKEGRAETKKSINVLSEGWYFLSCLVLFCLFCVLCVAYFFTDLCMNVTAQQCACPACQRLALLRRDNMFIQHR